jgi:fatty-acyl-CoA synthase
MSFTVTSALKWWVREHPQRVALDYDGEAVTFRELYDWGARVAARLIELGVERGDRVSAFGFNSLEYAVLLIGALLAGAVSAPVSFRSSPRELSRALALLTPKLLFSDEPHVQSAQQALAEAPGARLLSLADVRRLREAPSPASLPAPHEDDAVFIIGTSGSTGDPKGVIYSQRTIMTYSAEFAIMEPACGNGGSLLSVGPYSSASGTLLLMQFLSTGSTIYAQSQFNPREALRLLQEKKITTFLAATIFFERIADVPEFETADLSSMKFAQISGARVNPALLARYRERGVILRQAYGCTEAGGAWAARGDAAFLEPEKAGPGGMFSEFAIKGEEGGFAPAGTPGEILIRSPALAVGYWNNEAATAQAFRDGWLHTGDRGFLDENGNLTFIDRIKDIIISGGLNISALEVEGVIAEVEGVQEVVVIPAPDTQFGETPLAIVYGDPAVVSIDAIVSHCAEHLASYKLPRYIVLEDEPLPRLASGKVAKVTVRDKYKDAHLRLQKVR